MPKQILVAFETNAGSTQEVAGAIADTFSSGGTKVDVRRLSDISDVGGYDAAVIGAPMIIGWHRRAVKFIRRHQEHLKRIPVAYFMTALSLTDSGLHTVEGNEGISGIDIYRDPSLLKQPRNPDFLSFRERRSSLRAYLAPVLKKAPLVKPVSIGLFAGKLDYRKLKFPQMVFVMLLFAEKPRDYRDWDHIRGWATKLGPKLLTASQTFEE
ncbi:MAG: hypothetical protein JSV89_20910 [Spirochaetaceae bacterium]|nr:MAG: hypothetical protein JSV89_20910 [Spirochaetaceae bacterium]